MGVTIDDSLGNSGEAIPKFCNVGVLVLLDASERHLFNGLMSLSSISISAVRYGIKGAWFGYENEDHLLAFTRVLLGWTLSRLTVYGFSVPNSFSSGDVGILVKSVSSLSCGQLYYDYCSTQFCKLNAPVRRT